MTRRNRSKGDVNRWKQTAHGMGLAVGLALAVVLVASFFFADMGMMKYLAMQDHVDRLGQEIQDLERDNAALRQEIIRLQHDSAYIERMARDRLGYVRKGETVYQIVEEPEAGQ
jgi:cell division protein FtsB